MEITVTESNHVELISISGRVDSVEAPRLSRAFGDAIRRGRYRIVIDMSQLEYMSSAGFRALGDAQRITRRHNRGGVVLTRVPANIREALELVGFTEYFNIVDPVSAALEYAENWPMGFPADGKASSTEQQDKSAESP